MKIANFGKSGENHCQLLPPITKFQSERHRIFSLKMSRKNINMKDSILITGANGGIGQHVLNYLLKEGIRNIFCHYRRSHETLSQTLSQYQLEPSHWMVRANLTQESEVHSMVDEIGSKGFRVTKLINIAGSSTNAMSWKLSGREFMGVVEDSLLSSFLTTKAVVPSMRENQFGRIVNFSSIVGFTGMAGVCHYASAKAGLIGLTKSLAQELANKNITVNALALGYFDTGLIHSIPENLHADIKNKIPVKRFGNEADVGSAVRYLIDEKSSFITGQVIHLNGGQF